MTREDVLALFIEEANKLEKTHIRQDDIILQLAQLVADCDPVLQKESCDTLVKIGAILYKANRSRKQARDDIAVTMQASRDRQR